MLLGPEIPVFGFSVKTIGMLGILTFLLGMTVWQRYKLKYWDCTALMMAAIFLSYWVVEFLP